MDVAKIDSYSSNILCKDIHIFTIDFTVYYNSIIRLYAHCMSIDRIHSKNKRYN